MPRTKPKHNLQNIAIRTRLGKELRQAFQAQGVFISPNYNSLELRVLEYLEKNQATKKARRHTK